MKDRIVVINIKFTSWRKDQSLDEEWIKNRLRIFAEYTLNSIRAQTRQDFIVIMKCREETFDFTMTEARKIMSIPENVMFLNCIKKTSENELVKEIIAGYKYYYEVRLDSDDMYKKTYVDMLYKYNPKDETGALINQEGYIYDIKTGRLAPYHYTSPPYYTLIYKVEDYLKGFRHDLGAIGHRNVILLKHEILKGNNFLFIIHKENIHSTFELLVSYRGKEIEDGKEEILKEFGRVKRN